MMHSYRPAIKTQVALLYLDLFCDVEESWASVTIAMMLLWLMELRTHDDDDGVYPSLTMILQLTLR